MELDASIKDAIALLPQELRASATRWFERLVETYGPVSFAGGVPADLVRVVACSEFAGAVLFRNWLSLVPGLADFEHPFEKNSVSRAADALSQSTATADETKAALRRERNGALLHILWRELSGSTTLDETLAALSDVADELLRAAATYAERQMQDRFGRVRDENGDVVPMVVIGMGKLGGRELNFSSDIDVIFAYPAAGESDGRRRLSAQEYFGRLSRHVVSLMDDVTEDGFVFRMDTRLRPFGESGPPVVSFAALESYLQQHGRDWERYAYIKASIVGRQPDESVHIELFDDLVLPFVYRRYLDFGVFESLREMHAKISAEVARRELANNIKLGPGGIREIEFTIQSLQLVRGGERRELQCPSLQTVVPLLISRRGLDENGANALLEAYRFLRRLENFIQAIRDKQDHELPGNDIDRARLCLAMEYSDWPSLVADLDNHRRAVTKQFDRIAFRNNRGDEEQTSRSQFAELWERQADHHAWQLALGEAGYADAGAAAQRIVQLQEATVKIGTASRKRLRIFVPRLLHFAAERQDPLLAMQRCASVVEKILRRSAYIALLNENQEALERLLRLCERSAYIAEEIGRFPVLLDELLDPEPLHGPLSKKDLRDELEARASQRRGIDSEEHMELLAQFQRANLFRIAVSDFGGELPIMKVSDSLTFLAEAVLEHALDIAWRELTAKYGTPCYERDGRSHAAGFGVIAYGKLGGLEMSYGSDLDIVFLHDSRGASQLTDGDRPLDNTMFFSRLVRRLVHFLTTRTRTGVLYEVDTRLRPSGRKGLLVTSTEAFERYQDEKAWTWEHQALLRARAIAGSASVAEDFNRVRRDTLMRRSDDAALRDDVIAMRTRMRAELDKSEDERFDLKQGVGGIGDIEFLVQYLVLTNVKQDVSVIEFSDNIRQLDALAKCGAVTAEMAGRLQDVYRSYRLRQHHRVLNDRPALVADDEFRSERQFVADTWRQTLGT